MSNSASYDSPVSWAVVTGASCGIGQAFAEHLAERGLNLGHQGTVRPGGLPKPLGWSLSMAARSLRARTMDQIMRSMTAHQRHSSVAYVSLKHGTTTKRESR